MNRETQAAQAIITDLAAQVEKQKTIQYKKKASQVLQYMEDELDAHAILQLLNPYLKDEDLAGLYDSLVEEGAFPEDGYCM